MTRAIPTRRLPGEGSTMGWQRKEELERKSQRRTDKEIAMKRDHAKEAPSRYRDRQAARRRGEPMAARRNAPWYAKLWRFELVASST